MKEGGGNDPLCALLAIFTVQYSQKEWLRIDSIYMGTKELQLWEAPSNPRSLPGVGVCVEVISELKGEFPELKKCMKGASFKAQGTLKEEKLPVFGTDL